MSDQRDREKEKSKLLDKEKEKEKSKLLDKEKGEKRSHDPSFKGPMHGRSCTDIPCCIIFLLYIIGMIIVSVVAIQQGDPRRLLYPTDSNGKICGHDYLDKKYLLFFDITQCISAETISSITNPSCPTPQVCVEKCPDKTTIGINGDPLICVHGVNVSSLTIQEKADLIKVGKCAPYYIESTSLFYRCVPKQLSDAYNVLQDNTGQFLTKKDNKNVTREDVEKGVVGLQLIMDTYNVGMKALDDVQAVWYWLIVGFVVSMVVALIYIILTRWIAAPLIWVTMIGSLVALGYGMYICFSKYKTLKDAGIGGNFEWKFTSNLETYTQSQDTWLVLGIILVVVFIILLLLILVMRKRIQIATSLIKEASKAVCSMLSTLFFPLVPWLLQIIVFGWFIIIAVYLATNGVPVYEIVDAPNNGSLTEGGECDIETFYTKYPNTTASCIMMGYESNVHLFRMQVYHLFGWLWLMNFIIALGQVILAGAFASFYFAYNKPDDIPALPILSSAWRAIRYHVGSIAFGAAIVAIVQFIRITLEYIDRKLKEANQDNQFVKFIMKCMKCCFWCLEKCIRFLNKNAYIMIAIYGRNFCASAKDAFFLLLRNALRVVAINSVTTFLFFLGKVLIVGAVGIASYYFFNNIQNIFDTYTALNYAVVPMLITVIGAWVVCILFFDVYDMAIDTIFLCFLEDCERNDGSAEKPYFMSKSLKSIIGVSNKTDHTDGEEEPGEEMTSK